jgi:hypothetical protein
MRLKAPQPSKDFTILPNGLLESSLSPADRDTWLMIASVCRDGLFDSPRGMVIISELYHIPYNTFMARVRRLKAAGGLKGNQHSCELVIPYSDEIPIDKSLDIADETNAQAKRKPSGITQKESMTAIKKAWNENKPESYLRLDGSFPLPLFIAIETQAKRLGIERPKYPDFIAEVLGAVKADPWWSIQNFKASNVFGWSAELPDKKFQNVEKLYKSPYKEKRKFDYLSEEFWLKWYDGHYGSSKIIFKTSADYWESLDRAGEETDTEAAYIWVKEGGNIPHHWTGHNDQTTRKFRYLP